MVKVILVHIRKYIKMKMMIVPEFISGRMMMLGYLTAKRMICSILRGKSSYTIDDIFSC